MVIGEKFAWGHLPKTGGTATLSMFELFPSVVLFADPGGTATAHTTFDERETEVAGKLLALNIRRLPTWVLSRQQHKARWGFEPDLTPSPMDSPDEMADSSFPDYRLSTFLRSGKFHIERWLRTEALAEDFLEFISEFTDVPAGARDRITEIGTVNALRYDHDLEGWFTSRQLERMYARNPLWAEVERRVYGEILLEVGP